MSILKIGQFLKPNSEIDHCTAFSQLSMFFTPNSIPAIFPVFVLAYQPMFIVFVGLFAITQHLSICSARHLHWFGAGCI